MFSRSFLFLSSGLFWLVCYFLVWGNHIVAEAQPPGWGFPIAGLNESNTGLVKYHPLEDTPNPPLMLQEKFLLCKGLLTCLLISCSFWIVTGRSTEQLARLDLALLWVFLHLLLSFSYHFSSWKRLDSLRIINLLSDMLTVSASFVSLSFVRETGILSIPPSGLLIRMFHKNQSKGKHRLFPA